MADGASLKCPRAREPAAKRALARVLAAAEAEGHEGAAEVLKRSGARRMGAKELEAAAEAAAAAAEAEAAAAELTPEEQDRQAVRRVMMAGTDWQVLDLPPNAQMKWVKQSYRELARRLHPDKCKAPGAKDAFQKLSRAYTNITAAS